MIDFKLKEHLDAQQLKVNEHIKSLPEDQQSLIKQTQRIVQEKMDEQSEFYFGEKALALDTFFTTHSISGGLREVFIRQLKIANLGKTFTFPSTSGKYVALYKTLNNELMAADDYIYILEKSLMNKKDIIKTSIFEIVRLKIKHFFGSKRNG